MPPSLCLSVSLSLCLSLPLASQKVRRFANLARMPSFAFPRAEFPSVKYWYKILLQFGRIRCCTVSAAQFAPWARISCACWRMEAAIRAALVDKEIRAATGGGSAAICSPLRGACAAEDPAVCPCGTRGGLPARTLTADRRVPKRPNK